MNLKSHDLDSLLERMRKMRLLVLGDLMLDRFIYGSVSRISPEAPVPVVNVEMELSYPGGAANVGRNITDFGAKCAVAGLLGEDLAGKELSAQMKHANFDLSLMRSQKGFQTIQKTRVIGRNQQIVRVDREASFTATKDFVNSLEKALEMKVKTVDGVIVEDYGKGFISQPLVDLTVKLCKKHKKILTVDPNTHNPLNWRGVTAVKPNRSEAIAIIHSKFGYSRELSIQDVGEKLQELWKVPYILLTMGEGGMQLFQRGGKSYHTPTKAKEVFDVSGAGDTAIAFFTLAFAAGVEATLAAEIANHAAGIVVGKLGTATISRDELAASLKNHV